MAHSGQASAGSRREAGCGQGIPVKTVACGLKLGCPYRKAPKSAGFLQSGHDRIPAPDRPSGRPETSRRSSTHSWSHQLGANRSAQRQAAAGGVRQWRGINLLADNLVFCALTAQKTRVIFERQLPTAASVRPPTSCAATASRWAKPCGSPYSPPASGGIVHRTLGLGVALKTYGHPDEYGSPVD